MRDVIINAPVAGRDVILENLTYDVNDVAADPYPGLASYTYETRAYFGGREREIRDALRLLTSPDEDVAIFFVTGDSGSGKSSFAQAGLVPALESFYQARGRTVDRAVVRPGRHPWAALAAELAPAPSGCVRLLVLDQFEELFTQSDPTERDRVCAALSHLPPFTELRAHVLITLRADYLGALFNLPTLFALAKRNSIELRAMAPADLAQAIRKPLDEVNRQLNITKSWEPSLVQRLIEDVGSDPSLLPLLQMTLTSLWNEPPRRLTLDRYRDLTAALETTADRVYERDRLGHTRPDDQRQEIMRIFLDLVEVSLDDDPRRDVRRTLPMTDLIGNHPERAPLVDELVAARLLSTSVTDGAEPSVDIIHETLLRNWSRLRTAISAQREALQSRERFRLALHDWLEHDRSDAYLLQGVRLAEARELASHGDIVTRDSAAATFIERAVAQQEIEQRRELIQVRTRLRLAIIAAAAAMLAAVVAVAAFLKINEQLRINTSFELAAQAQNQLPVDPELSILLAREAENRAGTQQAEEALRNALAGSPARLAFAGQSGPLLSLAVSPDGQRIATGSGTGLAQVWDSSTGRLLTELTGMAGPITSISLSPDGRAVAAAASVDSTVRIGDTRSGVVLAELHAPVGASLAVFSPDSQIIATAGTDGTTRIWDAHSGELRTQMTGHAGPVTSLSFSPDGTHLVTGGVDKTARIWRVVGGATNLELRGHTGEIVSAEFDSQGRRVITAGADGTARVWDAVSGNSLLELRGHEARLSSASFSPDGSSVLTASYDGSARLWNAASGTEKAKLSGHTDQINMATFSADGRQVITASNDHTARVWDAQTGALRLVLLGHTRQVTAARFSPDGRVAVTSSVDGTVRTWRVDPATTSATLGGHAGKVLSLQFSPDGERIVSGGIDNTVRLWRPGDPRPVVREFSSAVSSVRFSPDGAHLAIGLFDGTVRVATTDLDSTMDVVLNGHTDWVRFVAFSPDGQHLLTASKDASARIWDTRSAQQIGELRGHTGDVNSAVFDGSGQRVVTAGSDGTVRIWDPRTFAQLLELRGHVGAVYSAEFYPAADGRKVVTSGADATIRVWDADTGKQLESRPAHAGAVYGLSFSSDGLLASSSADGTVVVWETQNWQPIAHLPRQAAEVLDVEFAPDRPAAQRIATASADGMIRVYPREMFAPVSELLSLVSSRVTRVPAELRPEERVTYLHE